MTTRKVFQRNSNLNGSPVRMPWIGRNPMNWAKYTTVQCSSKYLLFTLDMPNERLPGQTLSKKLSLRVSSRFDLSKLTFFSWTVSIFTLRWDTFRFFSIDFLSFFIIESWICSKNCRTWSQWEMKVKWWFCWAFFYWNDKHRPCCRL